VSNLAVTSERPRRLGRFLAVAALGLAAAACAARGPSPQLLAELGKAQVLQRDGCYHCMVEALAVFDRVVASPRAPADAVRGAFDTAVMLAVRSKELGLPSERYFDRARGLVPGLTALPGSLAPSVYLDAAAAIVGELSGFDPEVRQKAPRRPRVRDGRVVPLLARVALDAAPAADPLAGYLMAALDCEEPLARAELESAAIFERYGRTLPLRFRLAICGVAPGDLVAVREADPRWADTFFFEGRRQLTQRPIADVVKAVASFDAARRAFPESRAITLSLAGAQNALSNYEVALGLYDEVLAGEPTHRDALLGRVMSLSYLNRYVDAIASATAMIELGTWHMGDAYYWRAWNRYQLHQLPVAWDDIERATTLQVNTGVYTLAGFIAYARTELDTAIDRFDRAYAMDNTNCEAVWFAGLVHVDQQAWPTAAPKFSRAMTCFASAAAEARAEMARLEAATVDETFKARQIATAQKRVDTAEHRGAQAAFNAANAYVRIGEKTLALTHIDAALTHALLKEKAVSLKAAIEKMP
jgi:tetratricopeptide (TPR) repeat protein